MTLKIIKSLVLTGLFFTALELFLKDFHLVLYIFPILAVLTLLITIIPFKTKRSLKDRFYHFITIILLEISGFLFLAVLQKENLSHIFIIGISSGLFILSLLLLTHSKKYSIVFNMIVYFVFFTFFYSFLGLQIYFDYLSLWQIMIIVFVMSLIFIKQIFWYNDYIGIQSWFCSIILAFVISEIFWVISFWPTRYLINAITLLVIFYTFSEITLNYFKNSLTKRIVFEQVFVALFILIITFSTTKWSFGL